MKYKSRLRKTALIILCVMVATSMMTVSAFAGKDKNGGAVGSFVKSLMAGKTVFSLCIATQSQKILKDNETPLTDGSPKTDTSDKSDVTMEDQEARSSEEKEEASDKQKEEKDADIQDQKDNEPSETQIKDEQKTGKEDSGSSDEKDADKTSESDKNQDNDQDQDQDKNQDQDMDQDQDKDQAGAMPSVKLSEQLEDITVRASAEQGVFPEGVSLELKEASESQVTKEVEESIDAEVADMTAVDITFKDSSGDDVQPADTPEVENGKVKIKITSKDIIAGDEFRVVHITDEGKVEIVKDAEISQKKSGITAEFEADEFSIFAIVGTTTIEKSVLTSDGHNYKIAVTYGSDAGVPQDAELDVREILPAEDTEGDPSEYEDYLAKVEHTVGGYKGASGYLRLFDIKIVDKEGKKVEINAPVEVRIDLADKDSEQDTQVVHFANDAAKGELLDNVDIDTSAGENKEFEVSFEATGFSVYAIVDAPEPAEPGDPELIRDLNELASNYDDEKGFCLLYNGSHYFTNSLNEKSAFKETTQLTAASHWYFEKVEGEDNTYYIYTEINAVKQYMVNTGGNLMGLAEQPDGTDVSDIATAFVLSSASDGKFYFKVKGQNKWLQHSGSGSGIRLWTDSNNAVNSQISIMYASSLAIEDDPYHLNGKSYGIAFHDESVTSVALTTESLTVSSQERLAGKALVMRPDVLDHDGVLLVAENSDIQQWTFESIEEDKYYITTITNGVKKYLTIDGYNVTLQTEPDEVKSVISATPGTGSYSSKWHFSANGRALNLPGGADKGFNGINGSGSTSWMNLVEKSDKLDDGDFTTYHAKKVSVSDTENVYDCQQVIIYTRVWNVKDKKYEFFAVDHNGTMIPCYDTGDMIEWIGTDVNTALWHFTEYTNSDGTPNYYYELQNTQYDNFIAPQVTGNQVMSEKKLGINLNGRWLGENCTNIIAWDDDEYSYAGLKVENGRLVSCPASESDVFYFAVVHTPPPGDEGKVTKVKTIDSDQYGIEMNMIDYNNPIVKDRDSGQTAFFGGDSGATGTNTGKGLLSTNLGDDGYPVSTAKTGHAGNSLKTLYTNSNRTPMISANHIFLDSIYKESGYFEYDSTQNFAHLNDDGTFSVYDQLGAITGNSERKITRTHGQFMPYNKIEDGRYAYDSNGKIITNETDVLAKTLPDTNPRKGEYLYDVGNNLVEGEVDYFFGMEMKASFTQTASGLDAWGHDIVFEFSGDDDFWLYVDGELVLDLGGVHSAQVGSVNFRTGKITSSNGDSTLYDTFKSNYKARGLSDEEIETKLGKIFEKKTVDGETVYTFVDYSNHEMKMFYMERGAGASNLHMRFNLAAVKPGTVELSKKLSGTNSASNSLTEFPYQIYYATDTDIGADDEPTDWHLLTEKTDDEYNVLYKNSNRNVKYKNSYTPAGGSRAYQKVFFLKAGETAVIQLPEDTVYYYIQECGINPSVYDKVSVNGKELQGKNSQNAGRKDYATGKDTMKDRPTVDYDNHVAPGAMRTLSITKKLYDSDGKTLLHYPDNDTPFAYKLYLGNEDSDVNDIPEAGKYPYYVKDAEGNYCKWDSSQKKFVSLGVKKFDDLWNMIKDWSSAEKAKVIFETGMHGAISKIPTDHTVEVRDLVVGTRWEAEERDGDIPKGYTRRDADGYNRTDTGHELTRSTPISDVLGENEDPEIEIRNQKGWGLTVGKVWTDKDFMESHDNIYFAVYLKETNSDGETIYTLVKDSVYQLKTNDSDIYYFFDDLYNGTSTSHEFKDYVVREVTIENSHPTVNADGMVTDPGTVTPIKNGGILTTGGTPLGGSHQDGYEYDVSYKVGKPTGHNENIRTDTVTNSRPGIKLYKTDWGGDPLAGTTFTLKDSSGNDVAAASYTSADDGLITIAYLSPGTYTLKETGAPKGYTGLDDPLTITVSSGGKVTVSGVDSKYYTLDTTSDSKMAAVITIKDREVELKAEKRDALTGELLTGKNFHFALYRQVTDTQGNKRKDYNPMAGFEDLITDENGIIPRVNMEELSAGTYYLTETTVPDGYEKLLDDVCFTISKNGKVTIDSPNEYKGWLTAQDNGNGKVSYTMSIPNGKKVKVELYKYDSSPQNGKALTGVPFSLYSDRNHTKYVNNIARTNTDVNGLINLGTLASGTYYLVEDEVPAGYTAFYPEVQIDVTATNEEGGQVSVTIGNTSAVTYNETTKVYRISVPNEPGAQLPMTGGPGKKMFAVLGIILAVGAAIWLAIRKKQRFSEGQSF